MNITDAYKEVVFKKQQISSDMLVPIYKWLSGDLYNIERMQLINETFFYVPKDLLMRTLSYNSVRGFISYPKVTKDDEKLEFFYKDVQKYFGWSSIEFYKNFSSLDFNFLKEEIAIKFGYENKERKVLGLKPLKL